VAAVAAAIQVASTMKSAVKLEAVRRIPSLLMLILVRLVQLVPVFE
tara:strand:- start:6743 stop:6880 length:138 start_codon:yes stop_codon:yes gene_type:complete